MSTAQRLVIIGGILSGVIIYPLSYIFLGSSVYVFEGFRYFLYPKCHPR